MIHVTLSRQTYNSTKLKFKGLNNPIILDYYLLTLYEIENGISILDISTMLKEYESKELYLECAGILLALEQYNFYMLFAVVNYFDFERAIEINIQKYEYRNNKENGGGED